MKKLTHKETREIVFEHFCKVEHYKINKGYTKATLDQLIELYEAAYKSGYCEAINKIEKVCFNEYMKTMYNDKETK